MAQYWGDREKAQANTGKALERLGWELHGWSADASDIMTDYYQPERWAGIATKGDFVACVDVSEYQTSDSGKLMSKHTMQAGPCSPCDGTGKALREVEAYHSVELLTGTKHTTPAIHSGDPCKWCQGSGQREESRQDPDAPYWPTFQANPKGSTWHVDRGGRIVAKGSGVFAIEEARSEERQARYEALAAKIDAATAEKPPKGPTGPATVSEVTLTPSETRAGNVDLSFPAKPDEATRSELKACGFRWSRFSGCWYGAASKLPARYGPTPFDEVPMRDPGEDAADRWNEVGA